MNQKIQLWSNWEKEEKEACFYLFLFICGNDLFVDRGKIQSILKCKLENQLLFRGIKT